MEIIDKYTYKDDNGNVRYYINDEWSEAQEKWLETNNVKYLWEMYPGYLHAIKSCMIKRLKGMWIPNFEEKAEEAALYQIRYHIKHPNKKINDCMKWCSYLCMYALYGPKAKKIDKEEKISSIREYIDVSFDSFEDDLIEKLSKEGY